MGGYYASIAKSLERIADALEKMTAPSGQDRELLEKIESETLYKHQAPAEGTGAAAIESVRHYGACPIPQLRERLDSGFRSH